MRSPLWASALLCHRCQLQTEPAIRHITLPPLHALLAGTPQRQPAAPAAWVLVCSVDVRGDIDVPPPASTLPRPLLARGASSAVSPSP